MHNYWSHFAQECKVITGLIWFKNAQGSLVLFSSKMHNSDTPGLAQECTIFIFLIPLKTWQYLWSQMAQQFTVLTGLICFENVQSWLVSFSSRMHITDGLGFVSRMHNYWSYFAQECKVWPHLVQECTTLISFSNSRVHNSDSPGLSQECTIFIGHIMLKIV